ncbi:MAG: hypothetical protein AMXMBFR13_18600 [Phycisphaerae bacterium]
MDLRPIAVVADRLPRNGDIGIAGQVRRIPQVHQDERDQEQVNEPRQITPPAMEPVRSLCLYVQARPRESDSMQAGSPRHKGAGSAIVAAHGQADLGAVMTGGSGGQA